MSIGKGSNYPILLSESKTKPINVLDDIIYRIQEKIGRATYPELITYANGLHQIFGKGKKQTQQTKKDYTNLVIMGLIGQEIIPTVCMGQTDIIIDQFQKIVRSRLQHIMNARAIGAS